MCAKNESEKILGVPLEKKVPEELFNMQFSY